MRWVGDKGFDDITVLTEVHTVVARSPREAHQDIAHGERGDLRGSQQRTLKRGKEKLRKPEKSVYRNCGRRRHGGHQIMEAGQRKSKGRISQGLAGLLRNWIFTWK